MHLADKKWTRGSFFKLSGFQLIKNFDKTFPENKVHEGDETQGNPHIQKIVKPKGEKRRNIPNEIGFRCHHQVWNWVVHNQLNKCNKQKPGKQMTCLNN